MTWLRSWWYWPAAGWPGRTLLAPVAGLSAILLLLGALVIVHGYREDRQSIIDAAGDEARRGAFEVEQLIEGRLRILSAIASVPALRENDTAAAREYLASLDAAALGFDGLIFYVDTAGMMQAATTAAGVPPPELPLDVSYRPYVRPPLESGAPYVGAAFIGSLSPRALLPLLVPVRDSLGAVSGVIGGTLLLEPVSRDLTFAPGLHAIVVDRAGQMIVHDGVATSPIDVSSDPLLAAMRAGGSGVMVDAVGLLQQPDRLLGFAEVQPAGWTIVVSQPMREAFAPAAVRAAIEFGALIAALLLGLAIARWVAGSVDRAEQTERAILAAEHAGRETAERALQAREQEIDQVSHDLRSPLTVIFGSASYLRRRSSGVETVDAALVQDRALAIDQCATRMDAMIEEMLDAARLQAGRELSLNRRRQDLVEILRAAVEEQQETSSSHQIRLDAQGPIQGEWDAPRLKRVFANLLSNAVKFSPGGGEIAVTARVEPGRGGGSAVITVRDRGIGIPQEDLPQIFERFSRGRNAAEITGTGLGLAGTRHLVELHGGTITVESAEHQGSTFTLRFPLAAVDPPGDNGSHEALVSGRADPAT